MLKLRRSVSQHLLDSRLQELEVLSLQPAGACVAGSDTVRTHSQPLVWPRYLFPMQHEVGRRYVSPATRSFARGAVF